MIIDCILHSGDISMNDLIQSIGLPNMIINLRSLFSIAARYEGG